MDGKRSWRQVFAAVRASAAESSDAALLADFMPIYEALNKVGWMLVRDPASRAMPSGAEIQNRLQALR
jgi:hypothetical protein